MACDIPVGSTDLHSFTCWMLDEPLANLWFARFISRSCGWEDIIAEDHSVKYVI